MSVLNRFIIVFAFLFTCVCAHAQHQRHADDSLTVYFRQNRSNFEPGYMDNEARCNAFIDHIRGLQCNDLFHIHRVDFIGHASPEGSGQLNESLAKRRAENVIRYLHKKLEFADSVVFVTSVPEDWDGLSDLIVNDAELPEREEVIRIVRDDSLGVYRERDLKENHPRAWKYMLDKYFPALRNFTIYIHIDLNLPELEESEPLEDIIIDEEFSQLEIADSLALLPMPWKGGVTLKTNGLAWGIGQQNVAVEFDLAPHWSLAVPFYYSGGFDYFKSTIKFRGKVLQPEARYYFKPDNAGLYAGIHAGVGWYNFALDGDYRIQDHKGTRPAWGGGLGFGYTMQFKKSPAWGLEFALGAGVYDALYDKFYNEDNGPVAQTAVRKLFIGVDNAAVSVTYSFGKRKEGKR